jgi:4-amino-4-deoxy-L-arabinose transferase-like glycosyltransferase
MKNEKYISYLIFIIIIFFGIGLRLLFLFKEYGRPLTGDALGYYVLAKNMTNFYAASFREPFFILIVKIFIKLTCLEHFAVRVQSFAFSVFTIPLVYFLGKKIFNNFVGIFASGLTASNPFLAYNCVRGLRTEIIIFLFFIFTYILFVNNSMKYHVRLILLSITGAALTLVKISYLPIVIILILYMSLRHKTLHHFLKALLSSAIIVLLVLPFFISCKKRYNDAFYITKMGATAMRNQEFAGQPGFPSVRAVQKHAFAGKKLTPYEYVFKLHSPWEVIIRFAKGYYLTIFRTFRVTLLTFFPLIYFGVFGMIALLFTNKRYLVIIMLLSLLPNAFIIPLNFIGYTGADRRFSIVMYPFFTLCISWGVYYILNKLPSLKEYYLMKIKKINKD